MRFLEGLKAAALRRHSFVTGLLDLQQDSKFKVSMYTKAQQIGLPAVFVEIRHEATHGDMPSLTNLRIAAQRARRWLWDDYWKGLRERNVEEQLVDFASDDQDMLSDTENIQGGWQKWKGRWDPKPIGMI